LGSLNIIVLANLVEADAFGFEKTPELKIRWIKRIPQYDIEQRRQKFVGLPGSLGTSNLRNKTSSSKYLIKQTSEKMDIFLANLNKDGPGLGQKITSGNQPVSKIFKVAMNSISPGISKGLDLFGLPCDVI
jgi:hypothetical protein